MELQQEDTAAAAAANTKQSQWQSNNEQVRLLSNQKKKPSQEDSLTNLESLVSLIKGLIGTGILALPRAFSDVGLWVGLALLLFICFINIYCMRQLVYCAHFCRSKYGVSTVDYGNLAMLSVRNGPQKLQRFEGFAKGLVNCLIFATQFGICCVYFVFMADNTRQVVDYYYPLNGVRQWVWILIFLIPVLLLTSVRTLRGLAPFAGVANIVYLVGFLITFQFLFHDLSGAATLPAFNSFSKLPLFFGTVMFSFEGICLVLPIENLADDPAYFIHWAGVLNIGSVMVTFLYAAVGFFGFARFGPDVADVITLNLPNHWYYQLVKIMLVFAVWVTYGIQFHVPMEVIEKSLEEKVHSETKAIQRFLVYGVRATIVFITFAFAELIPHLALFISLVGSFSCSGLALVIPSLIEILCAWPEKSLWLYLRSGIICAVGILGFAAGTFLSISEIGRTFYHRI